ncbi:hypothetical protein D3C84_695440 [compost metagenome]
MIVQQTAIAERARTGARKMTHAFHHHRDRTRGEQGLAQIGAVQGDEARGEVVQRVDRRCQARVVDDQPLEVPGQPRTTAQVVGDH